MSHLRASVVIVSRHRPRQLCSCLRALALQLHSDFEVIVIADPPGLAALGEAGLAHGIKSREFDEPNISAARNLGINLAAAGIVAFLDDDATPEPTWLERLTSVFRDPGIDAAAGFVRGRNGFSFRWRGERVRAWGELYPCVVENPIVHDPADGGDPVVTIGANCAFRRDALVRVGGFDENFHYGLDDADLNRRLFAAGSRTAIEPAAEVHHVPGANATRTSREVPLCRRELGAGYGWWHRKYEQHAAAGSLVRRHFAERYLSRRVVRGDIEPRDMRRLLAEFDAGYREGQARTPIVAKLSPRHGAFLRFPVHERACGGIALGGHVLRRRALHAKARALASEGRIVTLFLMSASTLYHRRYFHPHGYWVQTGGVFGRSHRDQPLLQLATMRGRLRREAADLDSVRPLSDVTWDTA